MRTGHHQRAEDKNAAKRPEANKGEREEENHSGISSETQWLKRLRNNETCMLLRTTASVSKRATPLAKFLGLQALTE
jgi:hypothetical protein